MTEFLANTKETMSSMDIAELTGKQHSHVLRDIKVLLDQGVAESNFGLGSYSDANGQSRTMYNLTKKGCLILASGYDAVLREKIIDRWEVLETKETAALPSTYLDALKSLVIAEEQKALLSLELEQQRPKIEFYDTVTGSSDTIDMASVAKVLDMGIGRNNLFELLRKENILRRNNEPYQTYVDRGFFRQIESKFTMADGSIRISIKTVVYQKGVSMIRELLTKKGFKPAK